MAADEEIVPPEVEAAIVPQLLSVVVPFFDERDNLARFPSELFPHLDDLAVPWELILVDDGSRDGSMQVAREVAGRCERSRVLAHERNRGLGAAIRTGFGAAAGDVILTLDSDLTFHPRDAGALLERYRRGDVDLVSGSPGLAGYDGVPWWRIALSRCANLLYQLALGRRVSAVTPIFRLYRVATLRRLELTSDGFDINAEVLAKLLLAGARVAEVPVVLHTRVHGVSKLDNRAEILNHLRLLWRIVGWRLGRRR